MRTINAILITLGILTATTGFSQKRTSQGHPLGEKPVTRHLTFSTKPKEKSSLVLPDSYDLRTIEGGKYLSSVKDQDDGGTCWAFATMGAIESYCLKKEKGKFDFSEQHLATCHGFKNSYNDGGTPYMSSAYFARLSGPINETDVPYNTKEQECVGSKTPAIYIIESRFLTENNSPDNDLELLSQNLQKNIPLDKDEVKQTVLENGALYINLYMDDNFLNINNNTYFYCGEDFTNHAVLLVGWDDNKEITGNEIVKPKSKGAWICRNSWGTDWGEQGYFYVSYEDTRALSKIVYFPSISDYNEKITVFQYDDMGCEDTYGFGSYTALGLVKFSTQTVTQLKSIGLFIADEDEKVEVEVYDEFNGASLSGLLCRTSNAAQHPGYYNFSLPQTINLNANDDFYVKVTYISSNTDEPLAIENESENNVETEKYWIKESKNDEWIPIGKNTKYKFDLCIKAYGNTELTPDTFFVLNEAEKQYDEAIASDMATANTNQIKIYPNPANNNLNIIEIAEDELSTITIYNTRGQQLYSKTGLGKTTIPIEQFPEGLYILKIDGSKTQCINKFSKIN